MIRRPPRSTRTDTLFPDTSLFRSPVPLRSVLGEAGIDTAFAIPALGLVMPGQRLVLQRHALAHRAARIAHDLRPGVRVVLLDDARRARLLDRVLQPVALHVIRRVLPRADEVDAPAMVAAPRTTSVPNQRARCAAIGA